MYPDNMTDPGAPLSSDPDGLPTEGTVYDYSDGHDAPPVAAPSDGGFFVDRAPPQLAAQVAHDDFVMDGVDDSVITANLGGTPRPMGASELGAARSGQYRDEQNALNNLLNATVAVPTSPNPKAPVVRGLAGDTMGAPTGRVDAYGRPEREGGSLEAEADAARATSDAEQYKAAADAEVYDREARRLEVEDLARRDAADRQAARMDEQIEAQRYAVDEMQRAVEKMSAAPDVDGGRYWSSLKGYQKVGWAVSAIANGALGLDPMGALNREIDRDVDAQRATFGQRKDTIAGHGQIAGAKQSLFGMLREKLGDDGLAADASRIAHLEAAKARALRDMLRNGMPLQEALASKGIAELDTQISEKRAAYGMKVATTPSMVGGGRRLAVRGPQRADLITQRNQSNASADRMEGASYAATVDVEKQDQGHRYDIDKLGVQDGYDQGKEARKAAADALAAANAPKTDAAVRNEGDLKKYIATNTEGEREIVRQLEIFDSKYADEIPGFVWGIGWTRPDAGEINPFWSEPEEEAYQMYRRALMIRLRAETGAVVAPSEGYEDSPFADKEPVVTSADLEAKADAIMGFHMTEDALRQDVTRRLGEAHARISHFERVAKKEITDEYNAAEGSRHAGRKSGSGNPKAVEFDEGE